MFISPAYAQDAGGSLFASPILPIALMLVIFYFLLIRPQQRKAKEHRAMLDAIKRGDRVLTGGGIIGMVVKAGGEADELTVEIADGIRVSVARATIADVIPKTKKSRAKTQQAEERPKGLFQGLLGWRR